MKTTEVIKNGHRHTEPFSQNKLKRSIVAACRASHSPEGQSETTAQNVCGQVEHWLKGRAEVTSRDIRGTAALALEKYEPEAAYLYRQRDITI